MFDCSRHQIHQRFPSPTNAPAVTGKTPPPKKTEQSFSGEAGQVLVNMLERKRNYTEVWHQTLDGPVQSKEAGGEECGRVCACLKSPEENTLWTKVVGCFNMHTHTQNYLLNWACWWLLLVPLRPAQAALNGWMENNGRASRVPGNG